MVAEEERRGEGGGGVRGEGRGSGEAGTINGSMTNTSRSEVHTLPYLRPLLFKNRSFCAHAPLFYLFVTCLPRVTNTFRVFRVHSGTTTTTTHSRVPKYSSQGFCLHTHMTGGLCCLV